MFRRRFAAAVVVVCAMWLAGTYTAIHAVPAPGSSPQAPAPASSLQPRCDRRHQQVLHQLPLGAPAHRWCRAAGGRRRESRRERRALGTRRREASRRVDAAGRVAAARRRDLRGPRGPPRSRARPRVGGVAESRADQRGPPPESHRVQERDPRPLRARRRRRDALAGRRDGRRQLRQFRRRADDFHRASRAVPVGGAAGDAAGDRLATGEPRPAAVRDPAARRAGRPPERGLCRSDRAAGWPSRFTSP